MTDIQKAIKFAKSEIKRLELAPKINGCEMTEWWKEQIKIWETAISALEKQIPKKPILDTIFPSGVKWWRCPVCNKIIVGCIANRPQKYCSNCGQDLDSTVMGVIPNER